MNTVKFLILCTASVAACASLAGCKQTSTTDTKSGYNAYVTRSADDKCPDCGDDCGDDCPAPDKGDCPDGECPDKNENSDDERKRPDGKEGCGRRKCGRKRNKNRRRVSKILPCPAN